MIEFWALAVSVLALVISVFSAVFALYFSPSATTAQRLTQQENDLTDLADRVHHWMRRDSVRKTRERPAEQPEAQPASNHPKANLYARARALRGIPNEPA